MGKQPSKTPVSDVAICRVFAKADDPVLTTSEVAADLPIGQRAVLKRLTALVDEEIVYSKKVGAKARVWWLDEDVTRDDLEIAAMDDGIPERERLELAAKYSTSSSRSSYWKGRNS